VPEGVDDKDNKEVKVWGGEKNHCGVQEIVVRLSSYIVIRLFSRAGQEIMESST
jgi:hypothetical protein